MADHDLLEELAAAASSLDLTVRTTEDGLVVDGARLAPLIEVRAHPTPADLSQLVADHQGHLPALLVADRISDAGRAVLRRAGWGWLDRRGHLRLWANGLRIETDLPDGGAARRRVANPWTTVGLEIALASLITPDEPVTARRIARVIGRSVGATHELIARLSEVGLVGPTTHRPLLPELFWETAAHWPDDDWIPVPVDLGTLSAKVGAERLVRVDERAATLGGAHIAAAGDLPARCYLTGGSALRRARALVDRDRTTRCWVRSSPVEWLPDNAAHPPDDLHPWRVAHPLVCALRLAADPSRGREIVEAWGVVPGAGPRPVPR